MHTHTMIIEKVLWKDIFKKKKINKDSIVVLFRKKTKKIFYKMLKQKKNQRIK